MSAFGLDVRRKVILVTLGVGGFLLVAAAAWACMPEATIDLDASSAEINETVEGTGHGFRAGMDVEVHLDGADGPLLWSGNTDTSGTLTGSFEFAFEVPEAAAGHHVIVAFHPGTGGDPARAVLEITTPAAAPAPGPAAAAPPAQDQPAPANNEAEQEPAPAAAQAPAADQAAEPGQQPAEAPPVAAPAPQEQPEFAADAAAPAERPAPAQAQAPDPGSSSVPMVLALVLVGLGVALTLATSAWVVAQRREQQAWALRRRR